MKSKQCKHCRNSFYGDNILCSTCYTSLSADAVDGYESQERIQGLIGLGVMIAIIVWIFI